MNFEKLRQELIKDEGLSLTLYKCSADKWTIGIGRNLEDNGISHGEAMYMLDQDIAKALDGVITLIGGETWGKLTNTRKRVIVNMAFNLGIPRLFGFKKMLAALKEEDYYRAAEEMLNSKWAQQVGNRAVRLANRMRAG